MAEIVSLNQYRKARRRAEAAAQASGNRARHGRSKAEIQREAAERDGQSGSLDGKRVEGLESPPDTD